MHKNDPKRVGPWKIGRTIGKGSSGRVRIARHSKTGQHAAVKIVSKNVSLDRLADEIEHKQLALQREIVVMKLINHPNIMRLYDVWETSTELFLILEYVQGGELFEYLCEKGRLPTSEALAYFQQIISAVDYCHQFNIAHRDLKPENILLDLDRNIKIADFGMAAWQKNACDGMLLTSCGSPHYAAPEIIDGKPYNGSAADIWSCGVILYALLSGKLPFDDEDCSALLGKVMVGKYDMPQDVDPLAQDLIKKMLEIDPRRRITMVDIQRHPFYLSKEPNVSQQSMPCLGDIAQPIKSPSSIDPDIFANLRILWHGSSDQEILAALLNEEKNWQKGIYYLLADYRKKDLRDRVKRPDQVVATKIADANNQQRTTVHFSNDASPNTTVLVMNRPSLKTPNIDTARAQDAASLTLTADLERDGAGCEAQSITNRTTRRIQPRMSKRPRDTPRSANQSRIQRYGYDKENARYSDTPALQTVQEPKDLRSRIKVIALSALPKHKPSATPQSLQPTRTWLENVFKFRPTDYLLFSTQDLYTTRNECRRLVMEMGANVVLLDPEGLGTLKCRLDQKQSGVARTIAKFRVEMHLLADAQETGYQASLQVIRESGSEQVFKDIWDRLRRHWTLDSEAVSPYVIPAVSLGGRFEDFRY
ncbi:hypothetical protein M378DRAFT_69704 [Amanita muscaria Koide BX008]|uniref:non-specific serine/threonine protein kinase n=1 Tax=Amanita muscaria (strain Koide BX008) TaxID=946122 RepID=A0A0C2XJ34_AMAMK|nr:hypothetical protein M378DRAFT_69704 [Amanita muscaria Koide BX008]